MPQKLDPKNGSSGQIFGVQLQLSCYFSLCAITCSVLKKYHIYLIIVIFKRREPYKKLIYIKRYNKRQTEEMSLSFAC